MLYPSTLPGMEAAHAPHPRTPVWPAIASFVRPGARRQDDAARDAPGAARVRHRPGAQRLRVNLMRDAGATRVITNADRHETIAWDERHFGYRRVGEVEKLHEFGLPDVDRWTTLEAQLG